MKLRNSKLSILCAIAALCLVCTASLHGQITDLATFNNTNGALPVAGLTLNGSTLYGTTEGGGANSYYGVVFSLPVGGGTPNVLASFNNTNGANPYAGLILSGTTLYGTTYGGGTYAAGVVFSLPVGGGTPTDLATFNPSNGLNPAGGLTLSGSTLYGTTHGAGANGYGEIFSLPVSGGAPSILASFNNTNGAFPAVGLTLSGSTLYGTTHGGGTSSEGVVFSEPLGGGAPTVLATFTGTNGAYPAAGLTLSADGNTLYGTTSLGGVNGDGEVFSIPVGGGALTILTSLNGTNGMSPEAGLTLSADGSTLYGTTNSGGTNNDGVVFSVPVGGGAPTILASFNGTNGMNPQAGLTLSADGSTLYGTAKNGGTNNDGVVFSVPTGLGVPEPGSAALLFAGLFLATMRRRR